MARIRTFKPEFFRSETIGELSPMARLCFMGLWTLADKDGRLEDRPRRIKAELFPYDDVDVSELITELEFRGLIANYSIEGVPLIWIPKFREHQRITGKEAETRSKFPPHPNDMSGVSPVKRPTDNGETMGKHRGNIGETLGTTGKEGKGKEGKGIDESADADSLLGEPPAATATTSSKGDVWVIELAGKVIDRLNQVASRKFTAESGDSQHLRARLKDGGKSNALAAAALCMLIIDYHAAQWLRDPKMKPYLRPSTLFGPDKWESRTQNAQEWDRAGRPPIERGKAPPGKSNPQTIEEQWSSM